MSIIIVSCISKFDGDPDAERWDQTMIDTMTDEAFKGNPTPVFELDPSEYSEWPALTVLQTIARELNQSYTVFVKRSEEGQDYTKYLIRSFTLDKEESFCGHGIMGAALVLGQRFAAGGRQMIFETVGGIRVDGYMVSAQSSDSVEGECGKVCTVKLEIPAEPVKEWFDDDVELREIISKCLGVEKAQILALGRNALMDLVIEMSEDVDFSAESMTVDAVGLMNASPSETRSQIITSKGGRYGVDFAKRVFAYGGEDQATGSTYCVLIPYWASRLSKTAMKVKQVSARTGMVDAESITSKEGYVAVTGSGITVMQGKMLVPEHSPHEKGP
ncbi:uncharacterized protein A1O5_08903 [Cladophialophora psammophila CBS 110553]|uniref:Phenazine biosynthesis protein n=1 Tax=Cladophialophora psammophila CBS 110553 TaxID=1182543 RepID=W9WK31_9EURO|nr:uncharacterized protein A1O5_08903 [Cladophialophora psammophila CBS 110553]EXJ68288.1 hypothetical protein A1O5_08903 [Cladophialophora psammophila CBS 110553]